MRTESETWKAGYPKELLGFFSYHYLFSLLGWSYNPDSRLLFPGKTFKYPTVHSSLWP